MGNILESASHWLETQRHRRRTREVTYRRGDDAVSLRATIGRSRVEQTDEGGTVIETFARDYLIRAQDLILGGERTVPQRGDRIEEVAADGRKYTFEVLPLAGESPWRDSDPYHETLRIHTKQIDAVNPLSQEG